MAFRYEVKVHVKDGQSFSVYRSLYITLVGIKDTSETAKGSTSFWPFNKREFDITVNSTKDIGELLMIKIEGFSSGLLPYTWHPEKVEVKSSSGDVVFCGYQWISGNKVSLFKEETALANTNPGLVQVCCEELGQRENIYRWSPYEIKWPDCIDATAASSLGLNLLSFLGGILKREPFVVGGVACLEFAKQKDVDFTSESEIKDLYKKHTTETSDYVLKHWKEDDFFGYQVLNGVNPMVIKRIEALPPNFPVTDEMVFPDGSATVSAEMENGNIFLCDYKILEGVETNPINGKKQYLAAPLVLLHKKADKMKPIAIQLKQKPGEDNPIFLPTDSEYDWLLAKAFVRSADFNLHELDFHLLRTHLLAEVFIVSLNRNLPGFHPIYKLLFRNTYGTLQINYGARNLLVSDNGILTKNSAPGKNGIKTIVQKALRSVTYASLCFPDDITDRGLEDVPNFFYKEDGRKLWDYMLQFVRDILGLYYKDDDLVKNDNELQNWIQEIFQHGKFDKEKSGIPQSIGSLDELVKFVTMVMFTCSAQHSAVNFGQYDFYGWMPNGPTTMEVPPPTKKESITSIAFYKALPDYNTTVEGMKTAWLLSAPTSEERHLPQIESMDFTEKAPHQLIETFKDNLEKLGKTIETRNKGLDIKYPYLNPNQVENSISI